MKVFALILAALAVGTVASLAHSQERQVAEKDKKWTCTVPSHAQLISAHYTGGKWANIHIAPFNSGGSYQATRDGDVAKGVTANGTEFTCTVASPSS